MDDRPAESVGVANPSAEMWETFKLDVGTKVNTK
jgi:hypothetical protein